ncbi:hypothetical protein BH23BAC3_BH23BAC3_19280 [soil metagenome]
MNANIILAVLFLFLLAGCGTDESAETDERAYVQAVSSFHVSLAASQTEEARFAFNKMNDVATAFPDEPAAWANLGVLAMRQGNFELAGDRFERARNLAPDHSLILYLSGLFESRRGSIDTAIGYFEQALESDPDNPRIRFSLLRELERQDDRANVDAILNQLEQLQERHPNNRVLMFEQTRIATREQNSELLNDALQKIEPVMDREDEEAVEQFEFVKDLAEENNFSELNLELAFLRNMAEPKPAFQDDLRQLQSDPNEVGFLITEFIHLPVPRFLASVPDVDMTFERTRPDDQPERADFITSATLLEDLPPIPVSVFDGTLQIDADTRLELPAEANQRLNKNTAAFIDFNYNFRTDIALATNNGFRLYRQDDNQSFEDITGSIGLRSATINNAYNGIWPADVDLDGDLDLVLAPDEGEAFALRNNTDDTFDELYLFDGAVEIIDFLWADLDADGAADALFLNSEGEVQMFRNLRSNNFIPVDDLPVNDRVEAMSVADLNADGFFDILLITRSSGLQLLSYNQRNDIWESSTLVEAANIPVSSDEQHRELFVADMDNNGSFDIIYSTSESTSIWLTDSDLNLTLLDAGLPGGVYAIFDIDGNNRLDLLGIDSEGAVYSMMNSGTRDYHARSIRARASGLEGDQRINSFGIGGEMEVRSGQLYQKQLISSPIVHFGLGSYEEAEMLRIIWPNGSVQAEFAELGMGSTIFNEQVLKGSCPWLFTHDGDDIQFITDILWRSPLGLRINAQETAGIIQTLDRVKIPGEFLSPVNGIYDLRITAELWETHFFDYVDLIAVDHPEDTEIFVDERFVFPAPDLATRVMDKLKPIARVTDQTGTDWTETVSALDGNYMKPFQKTSYQGLVEDHYIEIEIGESKNIDEPIWLIVSGWLRPTDSSINLALSQGDHQPPQGLHVEIPDGDGGWKTIHENFGVPAGKTKTILIDIDPSEINDSSGLKVRLSTTSEIYWDSIQWSTARSSGEITEQSLNPVRQELRYRGYSEWNRANEISPKLPDYSVISGTAPRWRDLIGYHTRFGDVSELLKDIDDRYVIMNAGDEMILEFESSGEPEPGYKRSYVFVSDGWVKDGDYNTEASKTVTPLPYHGQSDYEYGRDIDLTDDPVYQRHREDWMRYHTRYVTPEPFRSALIFDYDRK